MHTKLIYLNDLSHDPDDVYVFLEALKSVFGGISIRDVIAVDFEDPAMIPVLDLLAQKSAETVLAEASGEPEASPILPVEAPVWVPAVISETEGIGYPLDTITPDEAQIVTGQPKRRGRPPGIKNKKSVTQNKSASNGKRNPQLFEVVDSPEPDSPTWFPGRTLERFELSSRLEKRDILLGLVIRRNRDKREFIVIEGRKRLHLKQLESAKA